MPDLDALVVFAKVAEAGSSSEASRRLGMPISTMSRKLAELKKSLGVRLLERSTRSLRLTDVGAELLLHARRGVEVGEALASIISHRMAEVRGFLRLSAPPNVLDSLLTPIVAAFQAANPGVDVHVLVTDRSVDPIAEGGDLVFRVGPLKGSALVARPILRYRHQLAASPAYLEGREPPASPRALLDHRLMAFAASGREKRRTLDLHRRGGPGFDRVPAAPGHERLRPPDRRDPRRRGDRRPAADRRPRAAPPGRAGRGVPGWRCRPVDLSLVHLGNRPMPGPVRVFRGFAAEMAPSFSPDLPA